MKASTFNYAFSILDIILGALALVFGSWVGGFLFAVAAITTYANAQSIEKMEKYK